MSPGQSSLLQVTTGRGMEGERSTSERPTICSLYFSLSLTHSPPPHKNALAFHIPAWGRKGLVEAGRHCLKCIGENGLPDGGVPIDEQPPFPPLPHKMKRCQGKATGKASPGEGIVGVGAERERVQRAFR